MKCTPQVKFSIFVECLNRTIVKLNHEICMIYEISLIILIQYDSNLFLFAKEQANLKNESFQLNTIFMCITRSGIVCLSMKYVFGLFAPFVVSHKVFSDACFVKRISLLLCVYWFLFYQCQRVKLSQKLLHILSMFPFF